MTRSDINLSGWVVYGTILLNGEEIRWYACPRCRVRLNLSNNADLADRYRWYVESCRRREEVPLEKNLWLL